MKNSMKYRKKPVVIDAVQWTGEWSEIMEWLDSLVEGRWPFPVGGIPPMYTSVEDADRLYINTLEGTMRAQKGDWIIRGIKGEFYPCKPDIFEATYEAVDIFGIPL